MTRDQCLTVWRELLDVVRLIDAVQTVTSSDESDNSNDGVWQAGLTALTERRTVLACVLSLEDPAQLDAVYAYLVEEEQAAAPAPMRSDTGLGSVTH